MKWTEIAAGLINKAFGTLMAAFGDRANELIDRLIKDPSVADRVAKLILNNGQELSASVTRAKEIMGKNFLGVEEGMKMFGVEITKRQQSFMNTIPFSETTLTACKDTHVLVAVMPLSIVQIRAKVAEMKLPKDVKRLFYKQDWYDGQQFAGQSELEWRLIQKTPVADSTAKNWEEQQKLLDTKTEETPTAQAMVYTVIGFFLKTGERLFEKIYVRTSSLGSDGDRVCVGSFDADGLRVGDRWDDGRYDSLGVASSRKLNSKP